MAKSSNARIVLFPIQGWCVRAGYSSAHYFHRHVGESSALCGLVTRVDKYSPQWSRPRQAEKARCRICERLLMQAQRRAAP